jgi:hypothetical protein
MRWINLGFKETNVDVAKVERHTGGQYVADLCLKNKHGAWTDIPISVFWHPNPKPGNQHYFGYYLEGGNAFFCDAMSVLGDWYGAQAANGEIIFSRYRHDYRASEDETVSVDGGRDYTRTNISEGAKSVTLRLEGPNFVVVDNG